MNILLERHHFYHRTQNLYESFENFSNDVSLLADSCQFGAFKENLIRDRVIFGLLDKTLSKAIVQRGGNPSIEEVLKFCRKLNDQEESNTPDTIDVFDEPQESTGN